VKDCARIISASASFTLQQCSAHFAVLRAVHIPLCAPSACMHMHTSAGRCSRLIAASACLVMQRAPTPQALRWRAITQRCVRARVKRCVPVVGCARCRSQHALRRRGCTLAHHQCIGRSCAQANRLLMQIKEHKEMWTRSKDILEGSASPQTKFFGLQILDDVVQTQWKALPQVRARVTV
jgi:Importin-beta N-terminal domain